MLHLITTKAAVSEAGYGGEQWTWTVKVLDSEFRCEWCPDLSYNEDTIRAHRVSGSAVVNYFKIMIDPRLRGLGEVCLNGTGGFLVGTKTAENAGNFEAAVASGLCEVPADEFGSFIRPSVALWDAIVATLPAPAMSPKRMAIRTKAYAPDQARPESFLPYVRAAIGYWSQAELQAFESDQTAAAFTATGERLKFEESFKLLTGREFGPTDAFAAAELATLPPIPAKREVC